MILLDMFVYVLKLPYRFLMYVLGSLYGYKNKKIDHLKAHHYLCRNCQTANIFQPWALRKERLVGARTAVNSINCLMAPIPRKPFGRW